MSNEIKKSVIHFISLLSPELGDMAGFLHFNIISMDSAKYTNSNI